ncbi:MULTISPECIES: roadblock/LC7 domain-containing protein [unclassified Solwaraspora]|uniref:roadblock/LC7 domain-containing protein n=1 Tax=unclassified Solwaraspora TaxID=2627926 RepID=UPI00259BE4D7|nr:roadblock/LC7 domain-containing protein [Solwaraspora sp. WMMA2056]WJK43056.1 roadblock/LC7 domain-containing protein [Solwaraspora sp. WMMA2056]
MSATNGSGPAAPDPAYAELAALKHAVTGVIGSVVAGVDGLLLLHDLTDGTQPHDLAALAAATFGLGRQTGLALRQGPFRESTVRSHRGYFSVYAINDKALLAVLGADGLNVARLHIEARAVTGRLVTMLDVHVANQLRL